eukprot:jgi/Undpi1/3998/HiC_scaffold_16.g07366.m1
MRGIASSSSQGRQTRFESSPDDVFHVEVQRPPDGTHVIIAGDKTRPFSAAEESYRRLHCAVIDGKLDSLRKLLVQSNVDVNSRSSTGNTVGHEAAIEGRANLMSLLIGHGLDIDAVNEDGNTALHLASRHGMIEVAQCLAEAYPDEEIKNRKGFTALDEAVQADQARCTANSGVRGFADREKARAEAIVKQRDAERNRLEKRRRDKEILFGRDLDNQPREEDFLSLRTYDITSSEKALICASLQASTVTLRCAAAGLQSAEELLQERDTER